MKFFGKELKFNNNKVYHAGDKPTPAEIGAAASSHTHNLPSASTSAAGIVQLNDATNSTSTTQAATANAVKQAYDRAEQAFQYANDGKTKIATAIIGKGVSASSSDSFQVLSDKISQIKTGGDFHADLKVASETPEIGGVKVILNTHDFFKQYQVNGGTWQSSPTFHGLEGTSTCTFRARYDTTTESSNITSVTKTLIKGNQQPPADPVKISSTETSLTFESRPEPQELWFNGSKATSNTLTGLQTGVAYPAYHRLPATATANEAVSNTLNFYTGIVCELGDIKRTFTGSRANRGLIFEFMSVMANGKVYMDGRLTCSTTNNGIKGTLSRNGVTVVSTGTSYSSATTFAKREVDVEVNDIFSFSCTASYSGYEYTGTINVYAKTSESLQLGFSKINTYSAMLYMNQEENKLIPNEYAVYYYNEEEDVVYREYYKNEEEKNIAMLSYENDDSMKAIKIEHIELNENQLNILNQLNNNESVLNSLQISTLPLENDEHLLKTLSNIVRFEEDVNEFLNSLKEENKNE